MSAPDNASPDDLASAVKAMDDLVEEAIQIYELDKEKTNITDELYNSLKVITNYLGFSIDVDPQILNLPQDIRIILMPSLDLLIIKPNFKSEQKRLDQLNLDEISNILKFIIPNIINMARSDRILKSQKVSFMREATKRLKRLPGSNVEDMIVTDTALQVDGI
ncbi:hypothetical protein NSIN_30251 [Nitrosotalea sinensis]|uniref:Uncharacterized protein n=1 Tax=Nitrosotalea sinensis TaxID=1499975 RepID=A0A2H1EI82_9ARCH|nr:hypothetical protein [Candidatus Nitrosotalea sinensis]SHO46747.1 hypothetical protein NSIN_30251 [Candidatus Nitrosotalea sinensis]